MDMVIVLIIIFVIVWQISKDSGPDLHPGRYYVYSKRGRSGVEGLAIYFIYSKGSYLISRDRDYIWSYWKFDSKGKGVGFFIKDLYLVAASKDDSPAPPPSSPSRWTDW